ncbi:MAG: PDZ domain-containing protein [Gemmatimonadota bacterium]
MAVPLPALCGGLALALLCRAAAATEPLADLPDNLPHRYGVLGVEVQATAPDTLRVGRLSLHSPAARCGLQTGDLLLGARPYRTRTVEQLSDYVQSLEPGTEVVLEILRDGAPLSLACQVTDRRRLFYLMGEQGRLAPAEGLRHARWSAAPDSLERAARRLIGRQQAGGVLDSLERAFALETERYAADCRLADVQYVLRHPLKAVAAGDGLAGELGSAPDLESLVRAASTHLDADLAGPRTGAGSPPGWAAPAGLEAAALQPLARAGLLVERAFAALDSSERVYLTSWAPSLLERFGSTFYLDHGDSAETEAHIQTLRLAKQVDVASLLAAAVELARLASPEGRSQLRKWARSRHGPLPADLPDAFGGDLRWAARTGWGWILVGGDGPTYYGEDALLIVDLGGDDVYVNTAGGPARVAERSIYGAVEGFAPAATLRPAAPVAAVVDLGGNDRYIANRPGSCGGALAGVGLLVDVAGDDLYQGTDLTQGAAFCGVGLLVDGAGNDVYLARESAQGCAYFGLGVVWDRQGADLYSSTQFSQGFGGTRGLGLLLDGRGHDRYVADRRVPSGYGTPGVFNGWSQGVGCGFRGFASGGLGVLVDQSGDDQYQAGNFSQGTGYFFGLGVLLDRGGDDAYRGTRYTQGASAHQAAGVLLDLGGRDTYRGRVAANQGGAWDVGIAVLEDRGGDDQYRADGLAQGAAAMNGLGILLDWGGADQYDATSGQAEGGSTEYWGGRDAANLGVLIDAGHGADRYGLEQRRDGEVFRAGNVGLFSDEGAP